MKKSNIERIYVKALNALVDALFEEAEKKHLTWTQLASVSGLSYSTVRNLGNRTTKFPQYRTVQLLAHAMGGKVQFSHGQALTWKAKRYAA